jgi:hypothetical protein
MRMSRRILWLAVMASCLAAAVADAQTYHVSYDAFGSAGSGWMSGPYRLGMTLGQPVAGRGAAATLPPSVEGAGFWHWGMRPTLAVQEPAAAFARTFALYPNMQNPFSARTTIRFAVPASAGESPVGIRVYDLSGRLVRTLASGRHEPGMHESTWDGLDQAGHVLGDGIYFCRMTAGTFTATRRIVLAR